MGEDGRIYLMHSRCTVAEHFDDCVDAIRLSDDNGESSTSPVYLNCGHELSGGPSGSWAVRYSVWKQFQGRVLEPKCGPRVLYSDNRGKTWQYGPGLPDLRNNNKEASVAEISNASLIMVLRRGYSPRCWWTVMEGL